MVTVPFCPCHKIAAADWAGPADLNGFAGTRCLRSRNRRLCHDDAQGLAGDDLAAMGEDQQIVARLFWSFDTFRIGFAFTSIARRVWSQVKAMADPDASGPVPDVESLPLYYQ